MTTRITPVEAFASDTRRHVLTVLRDEGLYRHLRIANPDTIAWWYEVVTWPGCLAIRGDFGKGHVFHRLDDMFEFFRNDINLHYWAEKLVTDHSSIVEYDEKLLLQLAGEQVADAIRSGDAPTGIGLAIREQLVEAVTGDEATDRDLLTEEFRTYRGECMCGARRTVGSLESGWEWEESHRLTCDGPGHTTRTTITGRFTLRDTWEWSTNNYSWSFQWACHAIRHAIRLYDAVCVPAVPGGAS